jgi:RNase P subunit RPR2
VLGGAKVKTPKKFERMQGKNPDELLLITVKNRVYIAVKGYFTITCLTGGMIKENALKLIEEYRQWWEKNLGELGGAKSEKMEM